MSRWWRAYDEALHDPKLIGLSDRHFRAWFNLLCFASKNGGTLPPLKKIALELRVAPARVAEYITILVTAGLIDEIEPGAYAPHNWNGRQFKSDIDVTNAARQRRYRARRNGDSNAVSNVTGKRPDTDTDTDNKDADASLLARKRASRLPSDWVPNEADTAYARSNGVDGDDLRLEIEKFRNHWHAKGGRDAAKLDWPATWRNWILNSKGFKNGKRPNAPRRQSGSELAFDLADEWRRREREAGIPRPPHDAGSY